MDFEIQRFTRVCAATGRELTAGEPFYSVLMTEGAEVKRLDYSVQGWEGPPEKCIGWWKSQVPSPHANKVQWAPNEVMLQFFEGLEGTDHEDTRYVLALLLVRRRVLRLEEEEKGAGEDETLVLYCPRRDTTFRVRAVMPCEARVKEIQEELARLLNAKAG